MTAISLAIMTIRGAIVMLIALGFGFCFRKSSAARRHTISVAAMIGLIALPFLSTLSIRWDVPVSKTVMSAETVQAIRNPSKVQKPSTATQKQVQTVAPLQSAVAPQFNVNQTGQMTPFKQMESKTPYRRPVSNVGLSQPITHAVDWGQYFVKTWFVLSCVATLYWLWGLFAIGLLIRKGREIEILSLSGLCQKLGIHRRVKAVVSQDLSVPATIGVIRPVIMLPEEAMSWNDDKLSVVLIHELAHIKRYDWLWHSLSQLACIIHVFNPFVWIGAKKQRADSEHAGDDLVIHMGIDPTEYARHLIDIARGVRRRQNMVAICMARKPAVENRILAIIDRTRKRDGVKRSLALALFMISCSIIVPIGIALPDAMGWKDQETPLTFEFEATPSKEMAPNIFIAENGIAQLPNGLKVRLVAISSDLTWSPAWSPTGTDIRKRGPFVGKGTWHPYHINVNGSARLFTLQFESPTDFDMSTTGVLMRPRDEQNISPSASSMPAKYPEISRSDRIASDIAINGTQLKAGKPIFGFSTIEYNAGGDTRTTGLYRLGVATGKWEHEITVNAPKFDKDWLTPEIGIFNPPPKEGLPCYYTNTAGKKVYTFVYPSMVPMIKRKAGVGISLEGAAIEEKAVRVKFLDKANRELPIERERWGHPTNSSELYYYHVRYAELSEDTVSKCDKIVIETRPYQYIDFTNIDLRPHLKSRVMALGQDFNNDYTKATPEGYIAKIDAIWIGPNNQRYWDPYSGGACLSPDGQQKMASSLTAPHKTYDLIEWGKAVPTLFEIKLFKQTEVDFPSDVSAVFKVEGGIAKVKSVKDYVERGPGCREDALIVPTTIDSKETTIWVGFSDKPWRTEAKASIDLSRVGQFARKSEGDSNALVFNELVVVFGEKPYLQTKIDGVTRNIPLASKRYGYDTAKRIVAVLNNGERRVISQTDTKLDGAYIAKLRVGSHGKVNPVLADEIRSIEFQTRSYSWLKFEHVATDINTQPKITQQRAPVQSAMR